MDRVLILYTGCPWNTEPTNCIQNIPIDIVCIGSRANELVQPQFSSMTIFTINTNKHSPGWFQD